MKLYYAAGACSLATHITLNELGLDYQIEQVDLKTKKTASGTDYKTINSQGYVPALDVGKAVLTETPAILQYLADQHPDKGLAPAPGTIERAQLQASLNFTASELHKAFAPLFSGTDMDAATKEAVMNRLYLRMQHVEDTLADGRPYLMGDDFSIADTYCFVVCSWTGPLGIDIDRWPHIKAYIDRIIQRPSVQAAMKEEGLIS